MHRSITTSNGAAPANNQSEVTYKMSQPTSKMSRLLLVLTACGAMAFGTACSKQEERKPVPACKPHSHWMRPHREWWAPGPTQNLSAMTIHGG